DRNKRVLISGTFNAHPITNIAAIATLNKLASSEHNVYEHEDNLGNQLEEGLKDIFSPYDFPFYIAREKSAFCVYFMDHAPTDFHDILLNHSFTFDRDYRLALIKRGIYNFPLPIKQGSISFSHTIEDIEKTLDKTNEVIKMITGKKSGTAQS